MNTAADTLYVELRADTSSFERSMREMEQTVETQGARLGDRVAAGFKAAPALAMAGAAAVAGLVAGMVPAMRELATEAENAAKAGEMFSKTLSRTGQDAEKAAEVVAELSERLKVAPGVIQEGITTMLRAGGDLQSAYTGLLAAGASAAASGADVAHAIENAAVGIAHGRSELLEYAGVVVNASEAHLEYARSIGVKVDQLSEAQRVQAYANAIYRESAMEVEDLTTIMGGLTGAQAEAAMSTAEFRAALGEHLLPLMTVFSEITGRAQAATLDFVKGLDGGAIEGFAGQLRGLMERTAELTPYFDALKLAIQNALKSDVFQAFAAGVATAMAGVQDVLAAAFEFIKAFVQRVAAAIKEMEPLLLGFATFMGGVFKDVAGIVGTALNTIAGVLRALAAQQRGDSREALRILEQTFAQVYLKAEEGAKRLKEALKSMFLGLPESWRNAATNAAEGFANGLRTTFDRLVAPVLKMFNIDLGSVVSGMFQSVPILPQQGAASAPIGPTLDGMGASSLGALPNNFNALKTTLGIGKYATGQPFGANKNDPRLGYGAAGHNGTDVLVPTGVRLFAPADVKITAKLDDKWLGHMVQMTDRDGKVLRVGHMSEISGALLNYLKQNGGEATVKQGTYLGKSGGGKNDPGRGNSTGSHVHVDLRTRAGGAFVDPQSGLSAPAVRAQRAPAYTAPAPAQNNAPQQQGKPTQTQIRPLQTQSRPVQNKPANAANTTRQEQPPAPKTVYIPKPTVSLTYDMPDAAEEWRSKIKREEKLQAERLKIEKEGLTALQAARDKAFKEADEEQYRWAAQAIEREEKRLASIAKLEAEKAMPPPTMASKNESG